MTSDPTQWAVIRSCLRPWWPWLLPLLTLAALVGSRAGAEDADAAAAGAVADAVGPVIEAPRALPANPAGGTPVSAKVYGDDPVMAQVRRTVVIQPGDQVSITLEEDPDVSFQGEVSFAGLVPIPYLGNYRLAGKTCVSAEEGLRAALCQDLYERATPSVLVLRRTTRYVYIYGAVDRPGEVALPLRGDVPLVQALAEVGGLTPWAGADQAYLLRQDPVTGQRQRLALQIPEAFAALDGPQNLRLQPDDVILVPSAGSVSVLKRTPEQVMVYGAVKVPGKFQLPAVGPLTLMEAITQAGGLSLGADPAGGYILRYDEKTGRREKLPADVAKAFERTDGPANLVLQANDMIFVPTAGPGGTMTNEALEVMVTGEVNTPGLVRFAPGEQRTFLRAIFKAGNFSKFAKTSAVLLVRYEQGKRVVTEIDASKMIEQGFLDQDVELKLGDMIIVRERHISF